VRILLDSYAILELLVGTPKGDAVKKLSRESMLVCTTILNVYEVKYRLFQELPKQRAKELLQQLLAEIKVFPISLEDSLSAADLKEKHKPMGAVDCNSYAFALRNDMLFVTGDKDFEGLPGVLFL